MVRLRRSVSHVVGQGHLLTSGWVPLGPVRARQGSSGIRMGPYLSRTPIRVHRVIRQGSSGPVGPRRDISATLAKVRSGPKTSNLVRNGSRIDRLARNKDQMNRIACPDPSGPLLRPKTGNFFFLRKTSPGGPGGPRRPPSLLSAQAGAYVRIVMASARSQISGLGASGLLEGPPRPGMLHLLWSAKASANWYSGDACG